MSQTAVIMGTRSAGAKPKGGIARAPTAPAEKAISRRGQPHARMTLRLRAPRTSTVAGGIDNEEAKVEIP